MKRSFWFGKSLPDEFAAAHVRPHLSFNGQLHFQCPSCHEVCWGDITFASVVLQSGSGFPCPNCQHELRDPIRFVAQESRVCKRCGTQSVAAPESQFTCTTCRSGTFIVADTRINPPYPTRLFVLYGRDEPFGESSVRDVEFIIEYVRVLRMSQQFHQACIHLVAFIESLFEQVYGSSIAAIDLLNVASGLMRTVFRETGNRDAGYLAVTIMMDARDVTLDPIQRAVFAFNINQNAYSLLARREDGILNPRFGFNLKQYAAWLSRSTLAAFETLDQEWLAHLRAKQKWLLGDILKAGEPTEAEIDEALAFFTAALRDPALPEEVIGYVKESALSAESKRRTLTQEKRRELSAKMAEFTLKELDRTEGIQRLVALTELLGASVDHNTGAARHNFALRCLGEALVYAAANDPDTMLRHAGTILSRLVAGFAADRIADGTLLEGIAGVEAFRSMAIQQGNTSTASRDDVTRLEFRILTDRLLGTEEEPAALATRLLAERRPVLSEDLQTLLDADPGRTIIWCEVWRGTLFGAVVTRRTTDGAVETRVVSVELVDLSQEMRLPMADDLPGKSRAEQVGRTLRRGQRMFQPMLDDTPSDHPCVFVGPSLLASWPVDAGETLASTVPSPPRPITFAPTIAVAAAMRRRSRRRGIERVLVVSYGGGDLAFARREIDDIQAVYGSALTLVDGATATRAAVLEAMAGPYDVIHFSGHGNFDYLQPMQSSLCFDRTRLADGLVTAADIVHAGTIGRNPVIVMAACTSAAVLPNGSNNFLGLAGAFIRTGATSIIGARWPVSDKVAAAFSKEFHAQLGANVAIDRAVAGAKHRLREAGLDEWSAFLAIGG